MVSIRSLCLVVGTMLLFGPTGAIAQGRPAIVKVDPVIEEPLAQTKPVLGRIVARQEGSVATRVEGRVAQVVVNVGDVVEEGQLLAVLDDAKLQLERDLAEAQYQTALNEVEVWLRGIELLSQERDRLARLRESAAFSRAAYDDKIKEIEVENSQLVSTRSKVAEARIQLEQAQNDLEDSQIEAPYDAVVTFRHTSAGAYAQTGDPIVDLVNFLDIEIEADVPSYLAVALEAGLEIDAMLELGGAYRAEVRAVLPVENSMTRTRTVRFSGVGDELPSRAVGESVTLNLPIGQASEVVTVSKDAVTINQGQRMVFVAEDGKAVRRDIAIGRAVGARDRKSVV